MIYDILVAVLNDIKHLNIRIIIIWIHLLFNIEHEHIVIQVINI